MVRSPELDGATANRRTGAAEALARQAGRPPGDPAAAAETDGRGTGRQDLPGTAARHPASTAATPGAPGTRHRPDDGPNHCPRLRERLGNCPGEVRAALARLIAALERHGLGAEDRGNVEIVLAEVMNNVVEHALAGISDGWLELQIDVLPDRLQCQVRDSGRPMPCLALPDGAEQSLAVPRDLLPEGGFGWFLIRHLTCCLSYSHTDAGNRLAFWIRRGPQS